MTFLHSTDSPYCGPAPEPGALWSAWNLDPPLLAGLSLMLAAGLWRAANRRALLIGWGGLVLAFVSPLCALTVALFSARAAHHLVLLGLVAPALAVAWPLRRIPAPAAFAAVAAALVLWHLPAVYRAAWQSHAVYWLMQLALLLPSWAFWSGVISPRDQRPGTLLGTAALIGGLAGVMGLIGAVLTFSEQVLYPQHLAGAIPFGLDALADQQLAGLVMWVPGLVPLATVAALTVRRAWAGTAGAPA